MRINLKTLGCRLNEAELERWAQQFQWEGHQIVQTAESADLIVLNSCAVTQEAVRKSRQLIRRLQRKNPRAKLVVSGCYATLNPEEAAQRLGVDLVIANPHKDRLVEIAQRELALETMPFLSTEPGETALFSRGRQRAFIKVQDGCRYRCTFCIVTLARGAEKSRPIQEIINEINGLHRHGIQEVVLTGVHLGGYGSDLGLRLDQLIANILEQTDIPRLRLGSLEPWDLPESFFSLFENPRFMPHLHLPLQSGSDSVLRRMARRCKIKDFTQLVEQARRQVPTINITTDIMVGFPGETEQAWSETLAFIERIGFGHIHIFPYSRRPGTKAAEMADQVPVAVKKARSQALHKLAESLKLATLKGHLNRAYPILWEECQRMAADGRLQYFGYTPNYLRVATWVSPPRALGNQIIPARLHSIADSGDHLLAELQENEFGCR